MSDSIVPEAKASSRHSGAVKGRCPSLRWGDVGEEEIVATMCRLIERSRPFLCSGYWTHQILQDDTAPRWNSFKGIKSVLRAHGLEALRIDVSCTRKGETFRGDQANRQHVNLRLMDMVDLAEASEVGNPHWATAEDVGLDYYLCQCPIVSREPEKPEVLGAIAGQFRKPSCVSEEDLLQINLWLGAAQTTTNLHFDANNNLLYVLKGRKTISLFPPNMTGRLQVMPVFSESPNHSGLISSDTSARAMDAGAISEGAVTAEIEEGEALFIPEGWWHQVTSSPGTVAVNVWFKCSPQPFRGRPRPLPRTSYSLIRKARDGDSKRSAIGVKRPRQECQKDFASPLSSPKSTRQERNEYLRTMGDDAMQEELPRLALEHPADWARLVAGLDPLTSHVLTSRWESAGGAPGMPAFYEAIFGTSVGLDEGNIDHSGASERAIEATIESRLEGVTRHEARQALTGASFSDLQSRRVREDGNQLALQSCPDVVDSSGKGLGQRSAISGLALRDRLVHLREAFAREELNKLLHEAIGI